MDVPDAGAPGRHRVFLQRIECEVLVLNGKTRNSSADPVECLTNVPALIDGKAQRMC